jgi:hypothetical protein
MGLINVGDVEEMALEWVKNRMPKWNFNPGTNIKRIFDNLLELYCEYNLGKFKKEWAMIEIQLVLSGKDPWEV